MGLNGVGKTNMLDAIYYMCMTKSRFSSTDRNVMRRGAEFCRVVSSFHEDELLLGASLILKLIPGKRKDLEFDGRVYDKLSEHVGRFPVVFIAPDDTDLIREGSEARRKFVDNTICQYDKKYLHSLITYNRVLKQRSALLKQDGRNMRADDALLNAYDMQLEAPASYIHACRKTFVEEMEPLFYKYYSRISSDKEKVQISYKSKLNELTWQEYMDQYRMQDLYSQRCNAGIHKDDLIFEMNGERVKQFSSQGQTKSFVLALKLSQFGKLLQIKETKPILLLDDIFDKLDNRRVASLMDMLGEEEFGQVFLTDTDFDRVNKVVKTMERDHRIFQLDAENED